MPPDGYPDLRLQSTPMSTLELMWQEDSGGAALLRDGSFAGMLAGLHSSLLVHHRRRCDRIAVLSGEEGAWRNAGRDVGRDSH